MGKLQIFDSSEPLTAKQIEKFEAEIGEKLPADYRNFLLEHNGGYTEPDGFKIKWNDKDDEELSEAYEWSMLNRLFAHNDGQMRNDVSDLVLNYRDNIDRYPSDMIPIGFDAGANTILLGIKGENRGKVFFWAIEFEPDDDTPEDERINNIGLIADNFQEFLDSLYEAEE